MSSPSLVQKHHGLVACCVIRDPATRINRGALVMSALMHGTVHCTKHAVIHRRLLCALDFQPLHDANSEAILCTSPSVTGSSVPNVQCSMFSKEGIYNGTVI